MWASKAMELPLSETPAIVSGLLAHKDRVKLDAAVKKCIEEGNKESISRSNQIHLLNNSDTLSDLIGRKKCSSLRISREIYLSAVGNWDPL